MEADYVLAGPAKGSIDKGGSTLWFGAPPIVNHVSSPLISVCVCVSGKVNDFCLNGTISAIGIGGAGSLFFPLMLHLDDLW